MLNIEEQNESELNDKIDVFIDKMEVDEPLYCLFLFYRFYIYEQKFN